MKKVCKIFLLVLIFSLGGCQHNPPGTNPPVITVQNVLDQSLLTASKLTNTVSIGLRAVNEGVDQFETSDPEYYKAVHQWVMSIKDADQQAVNDIRLAEAGNTSIDWRKSLLNITSVAAKQDPETFKIKNPQSQAWFKLVSATLQAALAQINTTFGEKK